MTTKIDTENILRRCRFKPYLPGRGPRFALTTWDTGRANGCGKSTLGYRLNMINHERLNHAVTLFEGEDFHCSPCHCVDSDEAVASLMSFLTLRPGDTDADYFKDYTELQLAYCEEHAEALSCEVLSRFGEQ